MNIWIMAGAVTALIIAGIIVALVAKLISSNREAERLNRRIMSLEAVNASQDETYKKFRAYSIRDRMETEAEMRGLERSIIAYKGVVTKMKSTIKAKEWPAASEITKGE